MTCFLKDNSSFNALFEILEFFGECLGLKVNHEKTEIFDLGNNTLQDCRLSKASYLWGVSKTQTSKTQTQDPKNSDPRVSQKLRPKKLRPSGCLENSDPKNSHPVGVSKTQTQKIKHIYTA